MAMTALCNILTIQVRCNEQNIPEDIGCFNHGLSSHFTLMNSLKHYSLPPKNPYNEPLSGDTLFIGPCDDSLIVPDMWQYSGTIMVFGNARIVFRNVKATINADIIVWGENATLIADSSYLYFPQEYFYQRKIIAAGGSKISIRKTTLDYNGLSHNLAITDSSVVEYVNVTNIGFTTCGLSQKSKMFVDGCNETGEFIVQDSVRLDFANAGTIILWHIVDRNGKLHFTFPNGDSLKEYVMNEETKGLENIKYQIELSDCKNVMWGLMPKPGSDILIKDSKIRSIGVWFTGSDTTGLTGLVNNSEYNVYTAPIGDRSLKFENTNVQTWSIYAFDKSVVNISGCIVGEIGAFGRSYVTGINYMADGSGGYLFASDTAVVINSLASATCNVRSERSGILLFGYSAQTNGKAAAIGNSVLIIVQSGLSEEPSYSEGSVAWFANISGPSVARINGKIPITGSAWIDKAPESMNMDFKKYFLSYRKNGSSEWLIAGDTVTSEVRNGTLGYMGTQGLEPGNYTLKLTLVSSTSDEFSVEAVKSLNILPDNLIVNEDLTDENGLFTYPNPAGDFIYLIKNPDENESLELNIFNLLGVNYYKQAIQSSLSNNLIIDISYLPPGIYFLRLSQNGMDIVKKFVKN